MINREIGRVKFGEKKQNRNKSAKGISFAVTYHLMLESPCKIPQNNVHLMYINKEVRRTFNPRPIICFKTPRKICSYLVRAKLYPLK